MKLREGLFLVDIQRPSLGVKLLVGAVSRDASFICGLAMRRAVNAVDLMSLLPYNYGVIGDYYKRRAILKLNEDILKITILKPNMTYPSGEGEDTAYPACTHQRPSRNKLITAVSQKTIPVL
ncbi:hypothetical protein Tco_0267068 [Tanacetum coccineum]